MDITKVTLEALKSAMIDLSTSWIYHMLIMCMIVDVITGYGKAYKLKVFDSKIGSKGAIKHFTILIITFILAVYLRLIDKTFLSQAIDTYVISIYAMSIMENLDGMGIPLPKGLKEYFVQMQRKSISIPNASITIESKKTNPIVEIDKDKK